MANVVEIQVRGKDHFSKVFGKSIKSLNVMGAAAKKAGIAMAAAAAPAQVHMATICFT